MQISFVNVAVTMALLSITSGFAKIFNQTEIQVKKAYFLQRPLVFEFKSRDFRPRNQQKRTDAQPSTYPCRFTLSAPQVAYDKKLTTTGPTTPTTPIENANDNDYTTSNGENIAKDLDEYSISTATLTLTTTSTTSTTTTKKPKTRQNIKKFMLITQPTQNYKRLRNTKTNTNNNNINYYINNNNNNSKSNNSKDENLNSNSNQILIRRSSDVSDDDVSRKRHETALKNYNFILGTIEMDNYDDNEQNNNNVNNNNNNLKVHKVKRKQKIRAKQRKMKPTKTTNNRKQQDQQQEPQKRKKQQKPQRQQRPQKQQKIPITNINNKKQKQKLNNSNQNDNNTNTNFNDKINNNNDNNDNVDSNYAVNNDNDNGDDNVNVDNTENTNLIIDDDALQTFTNFLDAFRRRATPVVYGRISV